MAGFTIDEFERRREPLSALRSDMSHLLDERFRRVCRDRRWSTAVDDLTEGRPRTFDDLFQQYLEIGRQLDVLGVEPGSTVVALVGNRATFFPLLAACMRART